MERDSGNFVDEPHLMDFQKIIDRYIIDKQRTGERFSKGLASTYHDAASVQADIANRIGTLLERPDVSEVLGHAGARILEIGSGTGLLSRKLYERKHHRSHPRDVGHRSRSAIHFRFHFLYPRRCGSGNHASADRVFRPHCLCLDCCSGSTLPRVSLRNVAECFATAAMP